MAKKQIAATVTMKAPIPPKPKPVIPPVQPGQQVFLSVLPKTDIAGNGFDASPKVFATREAAQADCDKLNATRSEHSRFVGRDMYVC